MSKITEEQLHLEFIEKLIEADLLFNEDNLVYTIKNSIFDHAIYFLRTGTLSLKENNKLVGYILNTNEVIKKLKGE